MTRLDLLAQPTRRNGEHIRAFVERQKQQQQSDSMNNSISSNTLHSQTTTTTTAATKKTHIMSRSLTHLAGSTNTHKKQHHGLSHLRSLRKTDTSKSMTQLITSKLARATITPKSRQPHHTNNTIDQHQQQQPADNLSVTGVFKWFLSNIINLHCYKNTNTHYSINYSRHDFIVSNTRIIFVNMSFISCLMNNVDGFLTHSHRPLEFITLIK